MPRLALVVLGSVVWCAGPVFGDEPPPAPPAPAPAPAVPPSPAAPPAAAPPAAAPPAAPGEASALPAEVAEALKGLASEDRDARIAGAAAAEALQHEALVTPLVKALRDEYRTVREAAAKALALRAEKGAKAKAAKALEARLRDCDAKPDGTDELKVVVGALHDLAQSSSIEPLLKGVEPTTDVEIARLRLRAVANVPSLDAIEALIRYAAKGHRGDGAYRGVALQALEYATGTKLGSLDAWHQWWADHKKTFDVEAAARRRAEQRTEADEKRQRKDEAREKRKEREKKEGEKQDGEPKKEDEPKPKPQG